MTKEAYCEFITSGTFCTVWIVVAILLIAGIMVAHAIKTSRSDLHCGFSGEALFGMISFSLLWPATLLFVSVIAPFYGIYRLALYIADEVYATRRARDIMKSNMSKNDNN